MIASRQILVVEDEPAIAMLVQFVVERLGHHALGPAGSVRTATVILGRARPDLALLDVRLPGETSFPIADVLASTGVPFAFLTAQAELPERFSGRPVLRKPYSMGALTDFIQRLIEGEG